MNGRNKGGKLMLLKLQQPTACTVNDTEAVVGRGIANAVSILFVSFSSSSSFRYERLEEVEVEEEEEEEEKRGSLSLSLSLTFFIFLPATLERSCSLLSASPLSRLLYTHAAAAATVSSSLFYLFHRFYSNISGAFENAFSTKRRRRRKKGKTILLLLLLQRNVCVCER